MASYGYYGQHAARIEPYAGSVFLHSISVPFFQRKAWIILYFCMQNQPRPNLDGLFRFWPNASASEASQRPRIIGPSSGRTPPSHYEVPIFKLSCILTQMAWTALCITSPDQIRLRLTAPGFGQTDPVWKQAGCAITAGPTSGQCFRANLDRKQIGSDMITGVSRTCNHFPTVQF